MSIENLTIKEAKEKLKEYEELQKLFNIEKETQSSEKKELNLFDRYIGKYVICRTRNENKLHSYMLESERALAKPVAPKHGKSPRQNASQRCLSGRR